MWKPIPSCPGYFASEEGEILGPRGKLSLFVRRGYAKCQAYKKQRRVNRLVCEAFHGEPPSIEHHAAHEDGNRLNNRADNLSWKTSKQNTIDRVQHNSFEGENHPRAKLSTLDVASIKERKLSGETLRSIHKTFPGISYSTIQAAWIGRNWS